MPQNSSTIVAVFEDYSTAESVARDLANAGIPRESIDVNSNFRTGAAGRSGAYGDQSDEGGISGFFHRLFGGGHEESGHYAEAVRRGHAVVTVTAPEAQIDQAVEIVNSRSPIDIDRRVEDFRKAGYQGYDANAPAYSYEEANRERQNYGREGTAIPVVEEELQVGKRVVRKGGVRVYSRVVEQPVNESVELREEHVRVDRRPVDRAAEAGDRDRIREQSVEVTEMAEEPVVQKRTRVREEVVVGKETSSRTEQIHDTVRRTEVEVEQLNRESGGDADYLQDFRRDYESRYANSGESFESFRPAYEYGYTSANDARYRGRNWSDVEDDLRTDYTRRNPGSTWDRVKDSVRYGWEKVTGKR